MAQTEPEMKIRILLAAKKLFAKQGFDGTSVRQICEEAGANVALVSYYFGGKEKVFYALFENFFPGERISDNEELLKDPVHGLRLLVEEVIRFNLTDVEMSSIMNQEFVMKSQRTEAISSFTFPIWRKMRELLEKGKEQGVFRFDSLDQTLLFVVSVAMAHKKLAYFTPLLSDCEATPETAGAEAARFILRGLGVEDAGERASQEAL